MITLHSFPGALGEPSLSGFCTKAMILLNMSGETWAPHFAVSVEVSPFGKLPVAVATDEKVADSNLLIPWLEARGADLFPGLSSVERAQAHAVIRMAEENLRYGMMYDRWVDPEGWAAFMPMVFGDVPEEMRETVAEQVRGEIVNGLTWQGLGRFGPKERLAYFEADLGALTDMLWERTWLFGDQPTAADAAVLPILSGIEHALLDLPLTMAVRQNKTLIRYLEQGREALFGPLRTLTASAA
ncbi:glutathione S-transferase family protein [Pacificoceanicola onchidii]|uniref:glutathione S-transferase family protein n=1 Tax=Pacificoceanicola onchidii TaxID=2562685 RepID=UPI0014560089|nr:glutathione S-transferase family protein [Pacificoceanicola onchidii]